MWIVRAERPPLLALGLSRALVGTIFLLRTTPLLYPFQPSFVRETMPLWGWPDGGFHAPVLGVALPAWLTVCLCLVRTASALAFALGVRARAAGLIAGVTGYLLLAQDEFAFVQTLHLLFESTLILSLTDATSSFALVPDKPRSPASSLWLVRVFTASIYGWAALIKLRVDWMDGRALQVFYEAGALRGPIARAVCSSFETRAIVATLIFVVELCLGPALMARRTRPYALVVAFLLHAGIEMTAKPDVFGWLMVALLLTFLPARRAEKSEGLRTADDQTVKEHSEPPREATQ